jgi:flavin reductase (DIM6/NTAB) family NADH-FMN oxidoreductase RutF
VNTVCTRGRKIQEPASGGTSERSRPVKRPRSTNDRFSISSVIERIAGKTGSPILARAAAFVECVLIGTLEKGDHSVFLGEVVEAGLSQELPGRPDEHVLRLKDLGEKTFYGG